MPYVTVQRGNPPTPRQAEALELIKKFQAEHGYAPTTRDMMALMGMKSPNAVMGHFKALEKRGLIVRDKNVSRKSPNAVMGHFKALEKRGLIVRDKNVSRGIRVVEEKPKDEPRVRNSLRRCPHCGKPI
jgi:SOS-response transcriptional repressor LexA